MNLLDQTLLAKILGDDVMVQNPFRAFSLRDGTLSLRLGVHQGVRYVAFWFQYLQVRAVSFI